MHNLTASVTPHASSWNRPSLSMRTEKAPRRPQQLSSAGRHHPRLFHLDQGTPLTAADLTFPFPFPFPPAIADPHRRPFRFSLSAEIPQGRPGHATHKRPTDRRRARGIAARPRRARGASARHPHAGQPGPARIRLGSSPGACRIILQNKKKNARVFLITLLPVAHAGSQMVES